MSSDSTALLIEALVSVPGILLLGLIILGLYCLVTRSRQVIRSESEHGYWSADTGWVFDPRNATFFTATASLIMPETCGGDAAWVKLSDARPF
jgi:hypothetical protein